jgi:SOS-response transcriptional repressor LexA
MQEIKDRVRDLRLQYRLTQDELARRVGVKQQSIQQLEDGVVKRPRYILELARALNVRPEWLRDGALPQRHPDQAEPSNTELAPRVRGVVPVISWVAAGRLEEVVDLHEPGAAEEWQATTAAIREHTFALRVVGDSMEPEFTEGTTIIVEPDLAPENGDYVIVRNGACEATFKQLVRDGNEWYLKPLNPRYPIRPLMDAEVVGVVIAQEKRYR